MQAFAGRFREGVAKKDMHVIFPYRFDFEMAPRDVVGDALLFEADRQRLGVRAGNEGVTVRPTGGLLDQIFAKSSLRIALHGIHRARDAGARDRLRSADARSARHAVRVAAHGVRHGSHAGHPGEAGLPLHRDGLDRGCDGLLFLNAHPQTIVRSDAFWAAVGAFSRSAGVHGVRGGGALARRGSPISLRALSSCARSDSRSRWTTSARARPGCGACGVLARLREDRPFLRRRDRPRPQAPRGGAVAGAIAEELSTTIIAEGVEREEERAVLLDLGVTLAQGWLFGMPKEVVGHERRNVDGRGLCWRPSTA